jgi:hypothetical protein
VCYVRRDLRPSRASILAATLGAVSLLCGCYGSTEPATDIGIDRATLTAQGTANAGDAHVYFEYWPTGHPQSVFATIGTDVPGGSSGKYSEPTAKSFHGLAVGTQYSYRVCAKDQSARNGACAQTRTFTTARPAGDLVRGYYLTVFGGLGHQGSVDAHSGVSGANAGGTMELPADKDTSAGTFSGTVTCLRVEGNSATVGAVGTNYGGAATALFEVVDKDATWIGTGDQVDWTQTPGSTPPDCSKGSFATLRSLYYGDLLVYDAP